MKRLIRGIVARLAAVPFAFAAAVSAVSPASAESNGVGPTPAMGWSSWSFIRHDPTAANIEAQARAMKQSGLAAVGYQYVNIDDFWYECPGSQGPNVDSYGRWVIDPAKFPASGSQSGIAAVASYVHHLGLKFGLYVTPGISKQAVAQNTPIEGTSYTADQIAEPSVSENNYNCGGMVGIDYTKPGAQAFINSWANEFASWGVDYVKIDGVGSFDIPDVQAWSDALRQTGRAIHLELSNNLNIAGASTWQQYSNGWRTGGDIECYCGPNGSSYPLTDYSNVASRFSQVAAWQPYGGPGAFNDYDSIEVGNGSNDGLSYDERQTQMSLWALAASPFILGTDLTSLDKTDLALLTNRGVISVDQDSIDASRIADTPTGQTFAKTEKNGDAVVGLFNTSAAPEVATTSASALGLKPGTAYRLNNLWTHQQTETAGPISAGVPSHGVALFRVSPLRDPALVPPAAALSLTGLTSLAGGQAVTATESFTDNGALPALAVKLGLHVPSGWSVTATSPASFPAVGAGKTVQVTYRVVAPQPSGLFSTSRVTGTASYTWPLWPRQTLTVPQQVTTSPPVQAPYQTYSSASDAPAVFGQSGAEFGISGAGADLYTGTDAYSTVYQKGAVGSAATVTTEVTSQQNMSGYAKAGIIVRNDITASGTGPEGVILFESPGGGIQLEWNDNGGTYVDQVTPANGTIPESLPVWLTLVRSGSSYSGYYSLDGSDWLSVGTAAVPGQAAAQDAGMFVTSHAAGSPGQVVFGGFSATAGAATPALATSYEAESAATTLAGGAVAQTVSFTPTGSFSTVGATTVSVPLAAGSNTIEFANPSGYAPDFDRIIVAAAPG